MNITGVFAPPWAPWPEVAPPPSGSSCREAVGGGTGPRLRPQGCGKRRVIANGGAAVVHGSQWRRGGRASQPMRSGGAGSGPRRAGRRGAERGGCGGRGAGSGTCGGTGGRGRRRRGWGVRSAERAGPAPPPHRPPPSPPPRRLAAPVPHRERRPASADLHVRQLVPAWI